MFWSAGKTQTRWRTLRYCFLSSFWILLRGFRGEVENASANQRPRLSSCFSVDPKTINLVGDVEILLPVKFRWILFSGFRGVIENCPCQSETRAAILDVPIGPKNTNSMENVEILLPVKLRWIPFSGCREVEVNAGRRTDRQIDGRRTVRYDSGSLEPSAQVS